MTMQKRCIIPSSSNFPINGPTMHRLPRWSACQGIVVRGYKYTAWHRITTLASAATAVKDEHVLMSSPRPRLFSDRMLNSGPVPLLSVSQNVRRHQQHHPESDDFRRSTTNLEIQRLLFQHCFYPFSPWALLQDHIFSLWLPLGAIQEYL